MIALSRRAVYFFCCDIVCNPVSKLLVLQRRLHTHVYATISTYQA